MSAHLMTPSEWQSLSAENQARIQDLEHRLTMLHQLWQAMPAGTRESLQNYHPSVLTEFETALGLETK